MAKAAREVEGFWNIAPIKVKSEAGPVEPRKLAVREPSEAEKRLKLALKVAALHHTYSVAQVVGVYPA